VKRISHHLAWILAAFFFLTALAGMLFDLSLGRLMISWASFLAATALILGVFNLFSHHLRRLAKGNLYSAVLVVSMILVWASPLLNFVVEDDWATTMFNWIQAPLEAAVASLLLFFLVFAGIRLMKRGEGRIWTALFGISALVTLVAAIALPTPLQGPMQTVKTAIDEVIVVGGVRGILIGVALGTITMSIRILAGAERPYNK
jgi:hypothetical protein